MQISNNYIAVEKVEDEVKEGEYQAVQVQDSSTYKGKVVYIPEAPVYIGNKMVMLGSVVLFAKGSPDTHDIEHEGKKLKCVKTTDILFLL